MIGPVIVELSATRKAAVVEDEQSAFYSSATWHTRSVPSEAVGGESFAVRAVVETFSFGSGQTPRALLGGKFRPGPGAKLTAEVGSSRDPWNAPKNCASRLWLPFRAGLPEEYVGAVLEGLADAQLPPGTLSVDRAGHDEVNSSAQSFHTAAQLLTRVLRTLLARGDVDAVVRDTVAGWA